MLWQGDPVELCSVAQELALCSVSSQNPLESKRYADRAMALLREAVLAGFRNPEWLRAESMLEPLRTRTDFSDLLADAAVPVDPFSP